MLDPDSSIYVAGHKGLVGSALVRELRRQGYNNILIADHANLELTDPVAVMDYFSDVRPDYVILAAAKVGGILANNLYPADFISTNLTIQSNVISAAHRFDVQRLLFLGSSCIYPKLCPQPIREEYLLTGVLESTNRPYAIAKIAGIEMCWSFNRQYGTNYMAVMPTNLYGPDDNFNLETSHVLPALIRKAHTAKLHNDEHLVVWGTGTPRRELLHSDDMAKACLHVLRLDKERFDALLNEDFAPLINVGTGLDCTIRELAEIVTDIVEFSGDVVFDTSKPDGTPRKILDVSRIHDLGWSSTIDLRSGIRSTYEAVRHRL
jgi:GDP-L-fucose synthase